MMTAPRKTRNSAAATAIGHQTVAMHATAPFFASSLAALPAAFAVSFIPFFASAPMLFAPPAAFVLPQSPSAFPTPFWRADWTAPFALAPAFIKFPIGFGVGLSDTFPAPFSLGEVSECWGNKSFVGNFGAIGLGLPLPPDLPAPGKPGTLPGSFPRGIRNHALWDCADQ